MTKYEMETIVNFTEAEGKAWIYTYNVALKNKLARYAEKYRKKYADKVKNDPVWLTYSRAYKAHYARYMKKKMTQAEFQQWADFALDIREKALNGEISFEEYLNKIKV